MMQDTMVLEFPMDHNLVASHEKRQIVKTTG